ncbi:hypothetical protein [Nitrosomonas sp.]|uniref:hypothetical protein n=1 Tax=Nitrosomonas sp. TaxID=42353 RepID=UPI001D55F29A|nr:hypothetical protein [Nitrosomonas sp.]MCB1949930.1 hypothetical protein [Nitrosomonas sp.]
MSYSEIFGFLNYPTSLLFEGGKIEPVSDFDKSLEFITKHGNKDGYFYPPSMKLVEIDINTRKPIKDIPNTEKPAPTFYVPASHTLYIGEPLVNGSLRQEDAALIIHLLGFFFGTRLQFSDWRMDGKVPTKPSNCFLYQDDVPGHFTSHVYNTWKLWNAEIRKRYINILYMHSKADSCEWEWDEFLYRYMVLDAIYYLYELLGNKRIHGHRNRIIGLCEFFEIKYDIDKVNEIYVLRNSFFHEALWDGNTPGLGINDAFKTEKWLRRLNSRLIVAIANYRNDFAKSGWWFFGWENFDIFS